MMKVDQSMSIRNCLKSKTLFIAALCGSLSCVLLFLGLLAPFWFRVTTWVTYKEASMDTLTEYLGMTGFVDYNGRWHNLNMIQKSKNLIDINKDAQNSQKSPRVPLTFKAAQVLYISAFITVTCTTAGILILALKPYKMFVAEVVTTASLFFSAIACLLAIILSVVNVGGDFRTQHFLFIDRPYVIDTFEWAAYIGILGTVLLLVTFGTMVLSVLRTCRAVERVRRKPQRHLENEPLYYKFDYRKIPKVVVKPNPILEHVYVNPVMRSATPTGVLIQKPPSTPSAYSSYSYSIDPSAQVQGHAYPTRGAPYGHGRHVDGYGDSDMDASYTLSVNEKGQRMVSM